MRADVSSTLDRDDEVLNGHAGSSTRYPNWHGESVRVCRPALPGPGIVADLVSSLFSPLAKSPSGGLQALVPSQSGSSQCPSTIWLNLPERRGRTTVGAPIGSGNARAQPLSWNVLAMYFRDHAPPHFHAIYGDHEAGVEIRTGAATGRLPKRAVAHVQDWRVLHEAELSGFRPGSSAEDKERRRGALFDRPYGKLPSDPVRLPADRRVAGSASAPLDGELRPGIERLRANLRCRKLSFPF